MSQQKDQAAPSQFVSAAVGMGWQLAVVVLLPLVGGFKLDNHLGSMPLWTVIGFVIAIVGSILIVRHAVQLMGDFYVPPVSSRKDGRHDVS